MAYAFEAVVKMGERGLFQNVFRGYLENLGFAHMNVWGRFGEITANEFRRNDHLISFPIASEDQSLFRVVVHSESVPIEPLTLDTFTEGDSSFLWPFWQSLTEKHTEDKLPSPIKKDIRDVFQSALENKWK